jgi:hypothetical protein
MNAEDPDLKGPTPNICGTSFLREDLIGALSEITLGADMGSKGEQQIKVVEQKVFISKKNYYYAG